MTPVTRPASTSVPLPDNVVRMPVRASSGPAGDLLTLARYMGAWRRANPNATADEDIAAGAEIRKELGL